MLDLNEPIVRIRMSPDSIMTMAVFYQEGQDTILPVREPALSYIKIYGKDEYAIPLYDLSSRVDSISIFILNTDTLERCSWDEIREGYKIMRRFDISTSAEVLIRNHSLILYYPLVPEMKHIKMYPPYESQ